MGLRENVPMVFMALKKLFAKAPLTASLISMGNANLAPFVFCLLFFAGSWTDMRRNS